MSFEISYTLRGVPYSIRAIATSLTSLFEVEPPLSNDAPMLNLAVTEALNNVMFHSYAQQEGTVKVLASFVDNELTINVVDSGDSLHLSKSDAQNETPAQTFHKRAKELTSSGRGRALIAHVMDSVEHKTVGNENHTVLKRCYRNQTSNHTSC